MTQKLVIDVSVAAKWLYSEADSALALPLRDAYLANTLSLLAPSHFLVEFANLTWKKSTLRQQVKPELAPAYLQSMRDCCPLLTPVDDLLVPALAIANQSRRTVYDSLYVALALSEQCQLVTADEKLVRAMNLPWVISLANWN